MDFRDCQDLSEVGRGENAATRVAGRVDDDGRCLVVDEALHVEQVDLPVLVRKEVVLVGLDACHKFTLVQLV